jgi:GT2 family glycosyltransferase
MIPVLGVPILNRGDLLLDLVNSIDYPVEKLAIVQNGQEQDVVDAIEKVKTGINSHVKSVYVSVPFRNIGCGPSWNHIIKSFPEASLWIISNNDMIFSPGDLERCYTTHVQNPNAFLMAIGFALFGITPHVVQECGLFDENIYPAYFEDNDYQARLSISNVEKIDVPSTVVRQEGSFTIRSNPFYESANVGSYRMNELYYFKKWGVNQVQPDGSVGFKSPYDDPNKSLGAWEYDSKRRSVQNQYWNNMDTFSNKIVF